MDEFYNKVVLILDHKYDLDEELVEMYIDTVALCYNNGFSARRTAELVANKLFEFE